MELYRGKPILYDTGDFIDDYAIHPELRNDWSFLFRVSVEGGSFARLGSVSDSVVRHAHCPVLVVRREDAPDQQEADQEMLLA